MSLSELHLIRDIHEVSVDSNTVNYFVIPQKIQIFISHDTGLSYIFFFFNTVPWSKCWVHHSFYECNGFELSYLFHCVYSG